MCSKDHVQLFKIDSYCIYTKKEKEKSKNEQKTSNASNRTIDTTKHTSIKKLLVQVLSET